MFAQPKVGHHLMKYQYIFLASSSSVGALTTMIEGIFTFLNIMPFGGQHAAWIKFRNVFSNQIYQIMKPKKNITHTKLLTAHLKHTRRQLS
jgi:hypothetical protein